MVVSSTLLAAQVAAAVPRLLAVQVDTPEAQTADLVDAAVEHLADQLLDWHDDLVTGAASPADEHGAARPAEQVAPASPALATAIRAGRVPGSAVSTQAAALDLRTVAGTLAEVTAAVTQPQLRGTGAAIIVALRGLADALEEQSSVVRDEIAVLARLFAGGAPRDDAPRPTPVDQVLGRLVRVEHAVQRVAAATLRA